MEATVYRIADRAQTHAAEVRHPDHFRLENPTKSPADVVLGEGWSLYCLDIAGNRALFVELADAPDLADAPFVYAAQFDKAVRAASLPLDLLPDLARTLPEPANLSLLMSTGRCGSTLASRVFAEIPGVWSLSEPDWFTNLAFERAEIGHEQLVTLISACARLTCRPPAGRATQTIIVKPRSEMMVQAPAYIEALKDAHAVFLYRDCFGFVNSAYRFAQRIMGEKDPAPGSPAWEDIRHFMTINAPASILHEHFEDPATVQAHELIALGWALRMRAYLAASSDGMRVAPIHYADLTTDRRGQTALLLETCGIDAGHIDAALHGFDRDAHSGSAGANAVPAEPISDAQRDRVAELVARWGLSDYLTDRLPKLGAQKG